MRIFSSLFLVLVFFSGCQNPGDGQGGGISPFFSFVEKAYPVRTAPVTVEERPWVLEFPARLEALEQAVVRAESDFRIKAIAAPQDSRIAAGGLLAKVEHERIGLELEKKRAELKEAEAQLQVDRKKAGGRPGREEAEKEGEMRPQAEPVTDEGLSLSEARIERIKTEIAAMEADQERTEIRSPIEGIIQKRTAIEGLAVIKGDELFTIIRIDPIVVAFELPQEQIGAAGAIEEIRASFPPLEERLISPAQVAVAPERQTSGIRVTGVMSNEALRFKAGLEGKVRVITTKRLQVLKIPERAILDVAGKKYIYRIVEDVAHKVEVETGAAGAGFVEVNRGLNVQDQVVIEGQKDLREGVPVQIIGLSNRGTPR